MEESWRDEMATLNIKNLPDSLYRKLQKRARDGHRFGGPGGIVTSGLTSLEVLVVPYRTGNLTLAAAYESYLSRSRGLRSVNMQLDHLRMAAHLCALHASV
jgi:hypothetical protein